MVLQITLMENVDGFTAISADPPLHATGATGQEALTNLYNEYERQ